MQPWFCWYFHNVTADLDSVPTYFIIVFWLYEWYTYTVLRMVNIEKCRCLGHQPSGKSHNYSVLHQLPLVWGSSVVEWESASCFCKRLMIVLPLTEDRYMCNKCREMVLVKMFLFRLWHYYLSNRISGWWSHQWSWTQGSILSEHSALSQCRNLFFAQYSGKGTDVFSFKCLREVRGQTSFWYSAHSEIWYKVMMCILYCTYCN